jgi:hypothetical protein
MEVEDELKKAEVSKVFCAASLRINSFPVRLFSFSGKDTLRRLDISFNNIREIPPEISLLPNLRQLWARNNPLNCLPDEIGALTKIEEIDIRSTNIEEIPLVVSVLMNLHSLDWRGTPMAVKLKRHNDIEPGDLHGLKALLKNIHEREQIELDFTNLFENILFVKDGVTIPDFKNRVAEVVKIISSLFESVSDFRQFFRRCDGFLPKKFEQYNYQSLLTAKEKFVVFQIATQRKRLAADLELKVSTKRILLSISTKLTRSVINVHFLFCLISKSCIVNDVCIDPDPVFRSR